MKKVPIWKNLTLIASLIVVIIIATFAWFNYGPRGTVKEIGLRVGRATYIQVAEGGSGFWSEDLDLPITLVKRFKEVSGNGTNLFAPVYDDVEIGAGKGVYEKELVEFQVAAPDCYFEHILDFRSDVEQKIYLSAASYAKAWEANEGYRIDGAVRIAFFEIDKNGNETLSYIWAPNSKVEYSAETGLFAEDGSVEPYYYYQKSKYVQSIASLETSTSNVAVISTAASDENGCGYDENHNFLWSNGNNLPEDAPPVLKVDEVGDDGLFYKKVLVRVWLEGYDRECVSLLSGEKFIVKLEFNAQEEEA